MYLYFEHLLGEIPQNFKIIAS